MIKPRASERRRKKKNNTCFESGQPKKQEERREGKNNNCLERKRPAAARGIKPVLPSVSKSAVHLSFHETLRSARSSVVTDGVGDVVRRIDSLTRPQQKLYEVR